MENRTLLTKTNRIDTRLIQDIEGKGYIKADENNTEKQSRYEPRIRGRVVSREPISSLEKKPFNPSIPLRPSSLSFFFLIEK